jgi:hypothetical protein
VHHKRTSEIIKKCKKDKRVRDPANVVPRGSLVFADDQRITDNQQPAPKKIQRRIRDLGPNAVQCNVCGYPCANARGVKTHQRTGHCVPKPANEQDNGLDAAGDQLFEVQDVLDERGTGVQREYLVSWQGYTEPEWVEKSCLASCQGALKAYRKKKKQKQK